jgi:toxin ParE1/3/4
MLPIRWTQSARDDLAQIIARIAEENPDAAERIGDLIAGAIQPASEHPLIFRIGRVPGTREVVAHPNYLLVYKVNDDNIEVISVVHARQQYPHAS